MTKRDEKNLTKALAVWIAEDSRPVAICEDEGLENVLRVATQNKCYSLPSRKTIKSRVDVMYADMRTELSKEAQSVCLTCDYLTSTATENYLGITVYYITREFAPVSKQLGVFLSEVRHTTDNIVLHLNSVTTDWSLNGKVSNIVLRTTVELFYVVVPQ